MNDVIIVWLQRDLRLTDNPALSAALAESGRILPLYCHAPDDGNAWDPGGASRWWLHHSLASLGEDLRRRGSRLVLRRGDPARVLPDLARESGAVQALWSRRHGPAADTQARVRRALERVQVDCREMEGSVVFPPEAVSTGEGRPYRVFTPFWKACLRRPPPGAPQAAPPSLPPCPAVESLELDALGLLPRIPWDAGLRETWRPGEEGALRRLDRFCRTGLDAYADARELPAVVGTSRLSPRLHFGELSPRQVWWRAVREESPGGEAFLRELGWREFAHHLLHHFPETRERPMDRRFEAFPWREDSGALRAWQQGRTGIPVVDAGMRELWRTGWMHNRVRMVVASLLTKNLRIHWLEGARWFWDTLVDADLANNTLGWQWVAGCGADAAPYFRIFNPVRQGERFDPEGAYVRRWVPEIARLPDRWIHKPWEAPAKALRETGIRLGIDYPEPIVDLKASRREALEAYQGIKGMRW